MEQDQILFWNTKFMELIDIVYRRQQGMNIHEMAYTAEIRYTETPIKRTLAQIAILNRFVGKDKQQKAHENLVSAIVKFGEHQDKNLSELNDETLEHFFEFMTPIVSSLKQALNNG